VLKFNYNASHIYYYLAASFGDDSLHSKSKCMCIADKFEIKNTLFSIFIKATIETS